MVKLIPVLVANSVSRNIIPGILKSIETYTMIYDLDKMLDDAKKDIGISRQSKVVRNKLVIKEGKDEIVNFLSKEFLQEQSTYTPRGGGNKTDDEEEKTAAAKERGKQSEMPPKSPRDDLRSAYAKERGKRIAAGDEPPPGMNRRQTLAWEKKKKKAELGSEEEKARAKSLGSETGKREAMPKDASVSIGQFDMKSLALEPSWMKADLITKGGEKYSTLVGVKAIPVAVKSDARLHELIMWDAQIGRLMQLVVTTGRKVEGFLYRLYARTAGRIFNPDPAAISGNPYKDIVLKRTIISSKYVDKVYFVLNRSDLSSDFFEKAIRVRQLKRLGWQSFIIADDVNRSVSFCMIKFRGMCSTMPYTMLYQSMNQAKVFDDLEDVRRSSASLFKTKRPFKKIIGETYAQHKLDEFSADVFPEKEEPEFLSELMLLDESFGQFTKKVFKNPKAAMTRIFKRSMKLPAISPERLAKMAIKIDPDFHKAFRLAQKVISNSITTITNPSLIDWAALAAVVKGYLSKGGKNLVQGTREALKYLIPKLRSALKRVASSKLKVPPEHMFQVVFGTTILLTLGGLATVIISHIAKSGIEIVSGVASIPDYAIAKVKAIINVFGGNGSKVVNDAQTTADGVVQGAGEEMTRSGTELGLMLGLAFLGMGVMLTVLATLKERVFDK